MTRSKGRYPSIKGSIVKEVEGLTFMSSSLKSRQNLFLGQADGAKGSAQL